MSVNLEQLDAWMRRPEGEHLEFKEAKNNLHFEKLVKHCAALANEGGGHIVLGVTDKRPRTVVETGAFDEPDRTQAGIFQKCGLRVLADEVGHPDGALGPRAGASLSRGRSRDAHSMGRFNRAQWSGIKTPQVPVETRPMVAECPNRDAVESTFDSGEPGQGHRCTGCNEPFGCDDGRSAPEDGGRLAMTQSAAIAPQSDGPSRFCTVGCDSTSVAITGVILRQSSGNSRRREHG